MAELQRRMSSLEFARWQAFERLEPIGVSRADFHAGLIAATVANSVRDPKERPRAWTPSDFIPDWQETEENQEEKLRLQFEAALPRTAKS